MADSNSKLQIFIDILTREVGEKRAKEILAEASEGAHDLRGETEKATDSTEQFNVKGRAQFLLFSEINRILPGLGTALHAAFAGPLGPIILVGLAIASAKKALDDYNESLDKMGEAAAAGHVEQIKALRGAWDNVEIGMAKYFADLQAAAQDKDPTKTLIENLKKLQDEQSKAELEEMKLLGRPQSQIDALKDEHDKKTVRLLQEERNMRVADMANAHFAVDKDKERAALADARMDSRKNERDTLQKAAPDLEKQAEAARQTISAAQAALSPGGTAMLNPFQAATERGTLANARADLDRIQNEQKLNTARQKEIQNQNLADQIAKEEADKKLAADQAAAVAAQSRITELSGPQGEIAQTALREGAAASSRAASEIINQATDLVKNHAAQFADIVATLRYYNTHAGSVNSEVTALKNEMARHAADIEAIKFALPNTSH